MTVEDEHRNSKNNMLSSSISSKTTEDLIPTLPPEIIVQILWMLPVKSLLRCRSVCKAWLSLISDPKFVKSHLNLSVRSHDYAHHRLIYSYFPKVSLKNCSLSKLLCYKSIDAVELDCPLKHKAVRVVGSCNGLICITNEEGILYIWNPATRRSDRLPRCRVKYGIGYSMYGFGYLESNDDYKVVGGFGVSNDGGGYSTEVKMYSTKTENWKRICEFPNGVPLDDSGKFLNGALHWAASHAYDAWRIVSLDLAKETYNVVPQPVYGETSFALSLGVLGDLLTVMCNDYEGHWNLWVMKEYGVKESWTKLVSIPYLTDPGRHHYSVPLPISNDGKLLFKHGRKLYLYDPKDKHITKIKNMEACYEAHTYVESLVAPVVPARRRQ